MGDGRSEGVSAGEEGGPGGRPPASKSSFPHLSALLSGLCFGLLIHKIEEILIIGTQLLCYG